MFAAEALSRIKLMTPVGGVLGVAVEVEEASLRV